MSNINNQNQDLYSIELVQDFDDEAAATVSGGAFGYLALWNSPDGKTVKPIEKNNIEIFSSKRSLGRFNNIASWYFTSGKAGWIVYTRKNFKGAGFYLSPRGRGKLPGIFNNNIESVKLVS
ncbi:MAG: hypothetical protein V7L25_05005 [Nostoc sp.]|uniref:hypothetical protein n=1 Tax=Nostoc sp. TaxID=1180 RepID=UPI002FF01FFD